MSPARVAELVDALDSKSCAFGRAGSIPAPGTKTRVKNRARAKFFTLVFFFILILFLSLWYKNQSEKQSESEVFHSGFFLHSHSVSHSVDLWFFSSFSFCFSLLNKFINLIENLDFNRMKNKARAMF
jgi:preprotein translocase subunit SecG